MATPTANALRAGMRRGMISARIAFTSPSDVLGFLLPVGLAVAVLIFMRQFTYEGAPVSLGAMNLPSLIGMNVTFGGIMGIVGVLVMDRTNGTLLRAKSVPTGMTGYLVGEVVSIALFVIAGTVVLTAAGLLLFDGLEFADPLRWLSFLAVLAIGLAATMPIGAVLGGLLDSPKNMPLVMLPVMGLIGISGIFYPLTALPVWLQWIGQVFPMYWMGLGMRASLLPDAMMAVEVSGSWRMPIVFVVLAAWTIVGLVLAPKVLGRMARRESGSAVAERRRVLQQDWGG